MKSKWMLWVATGLLGAQVFAFEGFYPIDSIPSRYLRELRLDSALVSQAAHKVANLGQMTSRQFADPTALAAERAKVAAWNPGFKKWFFDYVQNLEAIQDCSQGCSVRFYQNVCSAVFLEVGSKTYLASAKHCLWLVNPYTPAGEPSNLLARYQDPATGSIRTVPLINTLDAMTNHYLPFEAVLFKVPTAALPVPVVHLARKSASFGESVFSVGIPSTGGRTSVNSSVPPYPVKNYFDTRITLGRVVYANPQRWSFCGFSNSVDVAKPHSWKAQASCDRYDYSRLSYPAREERNFMLTDTDMTYGMSGSPLFNAQGELIGIGNSILDDQAVNYVPGGYAIYSKAENIQTLLARDPVTGPHSEQITAEKLRIVASVRYFRAHRRGL